MFDIENLILGVGYLGLFAIIFAETGLFFGFFLPGDSLLFTAGILASQGYIDIYKTVAVLFSAAVLGDSVGYTFGHKLGKKLFRKKDSLLFHKNHLVKAKNFYEKHGRKTIIIARFVPIIRTFAPIVAGVGQMHYPTFLAFNIIGGAIWAIGLPSAGYFLGKSIKDIDAYLLPIIAVIIIISILPGIYEALKTKEQRLKFYLLVKKSIAFAKSKLI